MTPEFWRGKKVFVTGHTGFKGSWLCLWLNSMGAKVTGYSLPPPTVPSLFELADVASNIFSIQGDVRNLEDLSESMLQATPDVVLHLAAQPLVRLSYKVPVETYVTNVIGTVHVLEAIRNTPSVRAAVMITSDKCYENKEWIWGYREDEPMGGLDPYSNSKGSAELVVKAYRHSFFHTEGSAQIASARAGNVIGGGDFAEDRLIPDIIRALQSDQVLDIRYPDAIRPWQHVLEPLSGYLLLAEKLFGIDGNQYAEAWNFGPNERDAWTVRRIVEAMFSAWSDANVPVRFCSPSNFHEANWLKLDISKAYYRLGWQPKLPLPQALQWTKEWYQSQIQNRNVRQVTLNQIAAYHQLIT